MNNNLLSEYEKRCPPPGDICEHMPTLKLLADQCDRVIEMGTRSIVSAYGFLSGLPKTLICIDYKHPSYYGGDLNLLEKIAEENGVEFEFIEADSRKVDIGQTDLLFLDTDHTYEQLSCELDMHGNKSEKYIVCHDTGSHSIYFYELNKAIDDFLEKNPHWSRYAVYDNCEGLTVLKRNDRNDL